MKLVLLILPLILIACASNPKLSQEQKYLASYPVTITQEDFNFSDLLLLVKINHEEKTATQCTGLLPQANERVLINNLYMSQKVAKRINYEKKLILSLKDKQREYVVYHLSGSETVMNDALSACQRLLVLLQQDRYKIIND
jgi:hypothetical protein